MDENPYKAPAEDVEASRHSRLVHRRWLAASLALPSLLIVAFCLFFVGFIIRELLSSPENIQIRWSEAAVAIGFYSANAATWGLTAFATWKARGRAVIAALLADLALVVIAVLIG